MTKTIAALFVAAMAFAQSSDEVLSKLKAEVDGMQVISRSTTATLAVAGAPYSADETTTTTQFLFDGNRIVNTSATKVYRDQQGRTRVERTSSAIGTLASAQPTLSVTIIDPIANTSIVLDPQTKTANRASSVSADAVALNARTSTLQAKLRDELSVLSQTRMTIKTSAKSTANVEDLGTSNMAGVLVKGTRHTTVIPAGAVGNDRDIAIVDERWYSPELKMNIMTKHSDPRSGETVFQVANLTRSNPDPSLFQIPSDYQIKDGPAAMIKLNAKD